MGISTGGLSSILIPVSRMNAKCQRSKCSFRSVSVWQCSTTPQQSCFEHPPSVDIHHNSQSAHHQLASIGINWLYISIFSIFLGKKNPHYWYSNRTYLSSIDEKYDKPRFLHVSGFSSPFLVETQRIFFSGSSPKPSPLLLHLL